MPAAGHAVAAGGEEEGLGIVGQARLPNGSFGVAVDNRRRAGGDGRIEYREAPRAPAVGVVRIHRIDAAERGMTSEDNRPKGADRLVLKPLQGFGGSNQGLGRARPAGCIGLQGGPGFRSHDGVRLQGAGHVRGGGRHALAHDIAARQVRCVQGTHLGELIVAQGKVMAHPGKRLGGLQRRRGTRRAFDGIAPAQQVTGKIADTAENQGTEKNEQAGLHWAGILASGLMDCA